MNRQANKKVKERIDFSIGILPDVEIKNDAVYQPIEINMERKRLFFDFAVKYVAAQEDLQPGLEINEDIIEDFKTYLKGNDFTYETDLEISLNELRELIEEKEKNMFPKELQNYNREELLR